MGDGGGQKPAPFAWKTTMCAFFQAGGCKRGDQCAFAHDPSEIDPDIDNTLYIAGLPPGTNDAMVLEIFSQFGTVVSHRVLPSKTPGRVRLAAMIRYATAEDAKFVVENLNGTAPVGLNDPIKVKYANMGGNADPSGGKAQGKGGDARYSPYGTGGVETQTKTEMCHSWMESGSCTWGGMCLFAHGEQELGTAVHALRGKTAARMKANQQQPENQQQFPPEFMAMFAKMMTKMNEMKQQQQKGGGKGGGMSGGMGGSGGM